MILKARRKESTSEPESSVRHLGPAFAAAGILAIALLQTFAFGSELVVADGISELHLDPVRFLESLRWAWRPDYFLGGNAGAVHLYNTPYTWLYAALNLLQVDATSAQRFVMFVLYTLLAASSYWAVAACYRHTGVIARLAGSATASFGLYAVFNSTGSTPFLLEYAALFALVAVCANVADGSTNPIEGAGIISLISLCSAWVNFPLTALNIIVVTIFAISRMLSDANRIKSGKRLALLAITGLPLAIALNAYIIWPAVDFYTHIWLGGVLDESPGMHNADSSIVNVMRGLGQWSTFQGDELGPWYAWSPWFHSGIFSVMLWIVPIAAVGGLALRKSKQATDLFALSLLCASVPLAIGYYQSSLGHNITQPVYDLLYRFLPGFQMFRASYKWVSAITLSIALLFSITIQTLLNARVRAYRVTALILAAIPLLTFTPLIVVKENSFGGTIPPWVASSMRAVKSEPEYRVALFPSQYLERFLWGTPQYYIENSFSPIPLVYGYLGSVWNQGSDQWLRRAYAFARYSDPRARGIFAMLSCKYVVQRDDFYQESDFAFDKPVDTPPTVAHEVISDALQAKSISRIGPQWHYQIESTVPRVYAVDRPRFDAGPALALANYADPTKLGQGAALFSLDGLAIDDLSNIVKNGYHVDEAADNAAQDLAITLRSPDEIDINVQLPSTTFFLSKGGSYVAAVADTSSLPSIGTRPVSVAIDGVSIPQGKFRGQRWWIGDTPHLDAGAHSLTMDGPTYIRSFMVRLLPNVTESDNANRVTKLLQSSHPLEIQETALGANQLRIKRSGLYRVSAVMERAADPTQATSLPSSPLKTIGLERVQSGDQIPAVPLDLAEVTAPTLLPQRWYGEEAAFSWERPAKRVWRVAHGQLSMQVDSSGGPVTLRSHVITDVQSIYFTMDGKINRVQPLQPARILTSSDRNQSRFQRTPLPRLVSATFYLSKGRHKVGMCFGSCATSVRTVAFVGSDLALTSINAIYARIPAMARYAYESQYKFRDNLLAGSPTLHTVAQPGTLTLLQIRNALGKVLFRVLPQYQLVQDQRIADLLPPSSSDHGARVEKLVILGHSIPLPIVTVVKEFTSFSPTSTLVDGKQIQPFAFLTAGNHKFTSIDKTLTVRSAKVEAAGAHEPTMLRVSAKFLNPSAVDVAVSTSNPSLLVFGDSYDSRWTATHDSNLLRHVIVNGYANGWLLGKGLSNSIVQLRYTPQGMFDATRIVSILSFVVTVILLIRAYRVRRIGP